MARDNVFDNNASGVAEDNLTVRVLLVDDSQVFIQTIEDYLRLVRSPSFEVVGRVRNGHDAVRSTAELKPDLVLLDLVMPGMNGLEVARQIKTLPDAPRVIMLTFYDLPEYREAAQHAQADGFVGKSEFAVRLIPLIRELFFEQPTIPRIEEN